MLGEARGYWLFGQGVGAALAANAARDSRLKPLLQSRALSTRSIALSLRVTKSSCFRNRLADT
jgi:hypothetical protein